MKRRNFLKGFAAAVAVVTVAPMALSKTTDKLVSTDSLDGGRGFSFAPPFDVHPSECRIMTPKECLELYHETGILVWRRNGTLKVDSDSYTAKLLLNSNCCKK